MVDVWQFARFAREFAGRDLLDYVAGASPRVQLGHGVYTSTEYPSSYTLSLHNELSYTFEWPEFLFFYCVTPSPIGGETPLADSRAIRKSIDPGVLERFRSRKLRYDRRLDDLSSSAYSWQAAFETEDRAAVEKYCERGGVDFRWDGDGSLLMSEVRPATAIHPKTGDEVWFNQADGFHPSVLGDELYREYVSDPQNARLRLNVFFGDGGQIDIADLEHVRAVIRSEMCVFPWQAGDILVVDNMLACHGRMPFTGERKIILAMA
jgi:hypothetical protein